MSTFTLTITLGNQAMQTPCDVADALRRAAARIEATDDPEGGILDLNGNTVGSYRITEADR